MGAVRRTVQKGANLTKHQIGAWEEVQRRGNFGAHTAETIDWFLQHQKEFEDRELRDKGAFTLADHLWVSERRALEDIEATAEILGVLEGLLYGPPSKASESGRVP